MADFSQEDRLLRIKTTLGESELLLERFAGTEAVSSPFEFRVTLLSPNENVDLKALLRTPATVSLIQADGTERPFHAIFKSVRQAEESDEVVTDRADSGISNPTRELAVYEAVLVPSFWFLTLKSDCRIFQALTVVEIVTQVLNDAGIQDLEFRVNGTYPKRDYCVQYRENSFNFVSRLLEEEGIFYFFEHTSVKHTIVFADKSNMQACCPDQEVAEYAFSQSGWVNENEEGITTVQRLEQVYTGQAELRDYNFETPSLSLSSTLPGTNEEDYDYPGKFADLTEGDRYVRIRLEERETRQFVLKGAGRCRPFRPGYLFKLKEHFRADTNQDYFLVSVTHDALDSTYRQAGKEEPHRYENTFLAIPKTVTYRPPRIAQKPFVQGPQPALVVGKSGEEIWVDSYGRVKVQFYWDRVGKKNENSSCWVRVSQIWAGKNWGWMSIPRIGQEVIVDFLEGDPDRPIITGRVYNAEQTVPYTLPGNQTQTGIKSRSSKGGSSENFNEIRFEDLKGSELITIHAEKDMDTSIENNDNQSVLADRTITVEGTHTETITKDTTIKITEGNHSLTLNKGDQSIKLDMGNQSIKLDMGNQSITLALGNQTTKLDLGAASTEAMQSITLTVGASSIKVDQMGVTIQGMMIKINGEMMTQIQAGVMLTAKGAITMIN